MSAWRRKLMHDFPELGHEPERWALVDASAKMSEKLEGASLAGDKAGCKKIIDYLLWAEQMSSSDEQFVHFCVSALRVTLQRQKTRDTFVEALNARAFAQLRGAIEWITSPEETRELEEAIRLQSRSWIRK